MIPSKTKSVGSKIKKKNKEKEELIVSKNTHKVYKNKVHGVTF